MGIKEKVEKIMMAITFAEAGEHETAKEFLKDEKVVRKVKRTTVRRRPQKRIHARKP